MKSGPTKKNKLVSMRMTKILARRAVPGCCFDETVQQLRVGVDRLTAHRSGEELFGALRKMGHDMREVRALLQGRPGVVMTVVVNYKDIGGMAPLHRAARLGSTDFVQELMYLKADANAATYPCRAPGSFTLLQCLGEADQSSMHLDDMQRCISRLLQEMHRDSVCQKTTKGANVFHLAVARGNIDFLEEVIKGVTQRCSPKFVQDYLLNVKHVKGKTVLDLARYNRQIA